MCVRKKEEDIACKVQRSKQAGETKKEGHKKKR
jgi:hypothetical protein